jgi:hypothetical protein
MTTGWGTSFTNDFSGREDDRMENLFHKCFFRKRRRWDGEPVSQMLFQEEKTTGWEPLSKYFFRKRRRQDGEPLSQIIFQEEKTTGWGTSFTNAFSGREDDGMGNLFHKCLPTRNLFILINYTFVIKRWVKEKMTTF